MKRTIQFRGKTTEGKWIYGSCISNKNYTNLDVAFIVPDLPCASEQYDLWTAQMFRVIPETIGQFTSLFDKKHNAIYEGDILQVADLPDKIEVRFVRGVFAFLWNGDLDDEWPCNSPTQEWAEIIGNIHDNPTLLKQRS